MNNIQRMPPNQELLEQAVNSQPWTCCTNCGCEAFVPATRFKLISALQVAAADDIVVASNAWACQACGQINPRLPAMQPGMGGGPQ